MAAISVAFYIATSLGMTLINKQIFVQFPYPLVVTAFQVQPPAQCPDNHRPPASYLLVISHFEELSRHMDC